MVGIYLDATPWALPVALVGGVLVAACSPVVARWTRVPFWLVLGVGLAWTGFLSVTATPSAMPWVSTDLGLGQGGTLSWQVDTISWSSLTRVSERSLNVWLAVPLGLTSLLLARARRSVVPLLLAAAAPVAVESLQWAVPQLGRAGFLMEDVTLNWTGLAGGAAVGVLLLPLVGRSLRPAPRRRSRSARAGSTRSATSTGVTSRR